MWKSVNSSLSRYFLRCIVARILGALLDCLFGGGGGTLDIHLGVSPQETKTTSYPFHSYMNGLYSMMWCNKIFIVLLDHLSHEHYQDNITCYWTLEM